MPEDRLKAGMKERLVASLVASHEATETTVDEIYKFEEKLKRTYFHVKPLDHKQLRTWDHYLDWQVEKGDHERIVVLFERCLIPCALYEQFWAKYARYLEKAHKEGKDVSISQARVALAGDLAKARDAFNTGLGTVDARRDAMASWTLQGFTEKQMVVERNMVMRKGQMVERRRMVEKVVMAAADTGVRNLEEKAQEKVEKVPQIKKKEENMEEQADEDEDDEDDEDEEMEEDSDISNSVVEEAHQETSPDTLGPEDPASKSKDSAPEDQDPVSLQVEEQDLDKDYKKEKELAARREKQEQSISSLKVVELRARLVERGLDSRGTKPVLQARLREAERQVEESAAVVEEQSEMEVETTVAEQETSEDTTEVSVIGYTEESPEKEAAIEIPEEGAVLEGEEAENALDKSLAENLASQESSLGSSTNYSAAVEGEMTEVVVSSAWQEATGWEAVRDVYKRAAIVHCPRKAVIRMKWAQFEENIGQAERAREILSQLVARYPMLLEARMQQIDLERRMKNYEVAERMYTKLMKQIPSKHEKYKNMKTWIAMKLARFQFKICGNADKSLAVLRSALKKERGNPRLYSQIIDICYQRQPIDVTGVTAAIELALVSKDLSNMAKLEFVQRKVEFMQEFGDVGRYRDAWDQLKMFRSLCSSDLKLDARRKKELDEEEDRLQKIEETRAHAKAEANMKAKLAESEGRLLCSHCQAEMLPNQEGVYEFEQYRGPGAGGGAVPYRGQVAGPQEDIEEDAVIDLMNFDMDPEEEEKIRRGLEEKTKYKEVAPTWELNIEKYGYGAKRRTYDPDYEHVETSKYQEYARLEEEGYDEEVKDPEDDRVRKKAAPGLAYKKATDKDASKDKKWMTSDYIIPPKVPQANQIVSSPPPPDSH